MLNKDSIKISDINDSFGGKTDSTHLLDNSIRETTISNNEKDIDSGTYLANDSKSSNLNSIFNLKAQWISFLKTVGIYSWKTVGIYSLKALLFCLVLYALSPYSHNPKQDLFIHSYSDCQWLYFTILSVYLTLLTVSIGFIFRLTKVYFIQYNSKIFSFYNNLLPMAITFEIIVTITFWSLYLIDPELIVNKNNLIPGNETPFLEEMGKHAVPIILLLLDQMDVKVIYSSYQNIIQLGFGLIYYGVITVFAKRKGTYLYPFLNLINGEFLRFILFCCFLPLIYGINQIYMRIKLK
jgi:hypothetical protein